MRSSRLLSLLLLLQNRGRMSAAQLAAELGVTARTIYRDVEALAAAGVPIYAEQGPTGGYQLMDGYRTRLTGLTVDEAESLFLTGLPQPAAELGLGAQVAAAELKLMAALPTPYRDASLRIRQRFHLDAPGWYREPDAVPHLLAVAEALWQDQIIEVRYRRWSPRPGEVTRRLHPLGLVLKAGVWYLIAVSRRHVAGSPSNSGSSSADALLRSIAARSIASISAKSAGSSSAADAPCLTSSARTRSRTRPCSSDITRSVDAVTRSPRTLRWRRAARSASSSRPR